MVTRPWFTLVAVLLQCFSCFQYFCVFQFFFLSSTRRKQIGQAILDTDIFQFDVKPVFVQTGCGSLSRVEALSRFIEFGKLKN